ncbi:Porin P precursor [Posidoniimonas corsicana]|uniref:Porin P n=1 Tax=Posidoniimonas corsicana TaxID=1938618 RepID=A0A5C5VC44_9BACT|nr:porin [Posidoniimonas corsicana]TWT36184.1 Porin P precursor [Posidoniimonas corsicana]
MRTILIAALVATTFSTSHAEDAAGLAPAATAEPSYDSLLASQVEALKTQNDLLREQIQLQSSDGYDANQVTFSDGISTEFVDDLNSLLEWRESVEKAEAKAAAKAALAPTIGFKGRFFFDAYNFSQNAESVAQVGNAENAVALRWAWIEMGGQVMENTSYRIWFDLAGQVSLLDVYLDFAELPYAQNVRVGHFFEPFGMEQLTPNKYLTFMERASAFNLGRNTGVMAHSDDDQANWTYGLGVFVSEQGSKPPRFQDDNDATAITGRLTWLPWYDEATDGRGVFHLGVGGSYRNLADDTAEFKHRPESYMAPVVIDTGVVAASDYQLLGLEAAYAYGSFAVQAEYQGASVNTLGPGSQYLDGAYIQTSYFLTGENRFYNRRSGSFSNKIVPLENFFRVRTGECSTCTGWGAWELAYRYAYNDLNDTTIQGGRMGVHQLGLNWYLSPYTRAMLDFIHSDADTTVANGGDLDIVQMRMQFNL